MTHCGLPVCCCAPGRVGPLRPDGRLRRQEVTGGTARMAATGTPFARPEAAPADPAPAGETSNTENYQHVVENDYVSAAREPRSTFSASVDTAAYSIVRAKIQVGNSRPRTPSASPTCSTTSTTTTRSRRATPRWPPPWKWPPARGTRSTACCGSALAARKYAPGEMPARNLVFLIDTSGSMDAPNRLPLVKRSLGLLVEHLTPQDRVASSPTPGSVASAAADPRRPERADPRGASTGCRPAGRTNGGGGHRDWPTTRPAKSSSTAGSTG